MTAQYVATYPDEEKRYNAKLSRNVRRAQHVACITVGELDKLPILVVFPGGGRAPPAWNGMKDPHDSEKAGFSSSEAGSGHTRRSLP